MYDDPARHDTKKRVGRLLFGAGARLVGLGSRNGRNLYQNANGVRVVALHETRGAKQMDRLMRLVDACEARFDWMGPKDFAVFWRGEYVLSGRDGLLLTFDDGHSDNFAAALYLASRGLRAVFFVIPSFLDRSVTEYYDFHQTKGVQATRFAPHHAHSRGLSRSQIKEMAAMGHLIGGHNYAHRNLGQLHALKDFRYEIERSLEDLAELLDKPCDDFAFGFGLPHHLSMEASDFLKQRCTRIYSSVRGLNIPGKSPRYVLREPASLWYPISFTMSVLSGSLDHRSLGSWAALEDLGGRLG